MFISLKSVPNSLHNSIALLYVLSVVPNPGIVIVTIFFLSNLRSSNVLTITRRAKVESSPPEIPTTAFLHLVCSNLLAKEAA